MRLKRYRVILADPPWKYHRYGQKGHGAVHGKYRTMTMEKLYAMPVWKLAHPEACALFLWGTWPKFVEVPKLVEAWGFRLATGGFVWEKLNADGTPYMGLGSYTRLDSEYVVLGIRGKGMTKLRKSASVRQTVRAPLGEHSEKPAEVQNRIEKLFPGPYVELFARTERPRWDRFGNQVKSTPEVAAVLRG